MAHTDYNRETLHDEVGTFIQAAMDEQTPVVSAPIQVQRPLCPLHIGDVFGALKNEAEPVVILMSNRQYADFRVFRNMMEIERCAWVILAGVEARLWDCPVVTARGFPRNEFWVVGRGPEGFVKQKGYYDPTAPLSREYRIARVEAVLRTWLPKKRSEREV